MPAGTLEQYCRLLRLLLFCLSTSAPPLLYKPAQRCDDQNLALGSALNPIAAAAAAIASVILDTSFSSASEGSVVVFVLFGVS